MNIRRGIFRLALVLSISAAIILPLCLLEKHPWVTCRVIKYEYVYEFKWKGETSYQHGERQIIASPNDIVEICDEIDEQNPSKVAGEKDLPKGFREVGEFPSWRGYPLKKGKGFYPSSGYKVKPRSKFFDVPGWQEYLHLVDITTYINWNRFFLVMAVSFTSVWFLYAFVRLVFIGFILKGFKNKSSKGGEPVSH